MRIICTQELRVSIEPAVPGSPHSQGGHRERERRRQGLPAGSRAGCHRRREE